MDYYFALIGIGILCNAFCYGAEIGIKNLTDNIEPRSSSGSCDCGKFNDLDPVCGSDGRTYINPMQLQCINRCKSANVKVSYNGPCLANKTQEFTGGIMFAAYPVKQPDCFCDINFNEKYQLYCTNTGDTFYSLSYVECVKKCFNPGLQVNYRGACIGDEANYPNVIKQPLERPECICNIPFNPQTDKVCANNGRTYGSLAYLFCLNKCQNLNLKEVHSGDCNMEIFLERLALYDLLQLRPHVFKKLTGADLECIKKCPETSNRKLVCGSDGVTYENPSQIVCARNCYNPTLYVVEDGPCQPTITNEINECGCDRVIIDKKYRPPVCGSDGRTYPSLEILQCLRDCKYPNLTVDEKNTCI